MFEIIIIAETICIHPSLFNQPTMTSVHNEIDKKYPNRVMMDVGLVICRYGDVLEIGDGVCVPGDGGAHHEVVFRLVVFRPFVEEVCVGTIHSCNEEGIVVSLGEFFYDIFIPAYWMLRPSIYDKESGLWVWTPDYGNEDDGDGDGDGEEGESEGERFDMDIGAEIRIKVKGINFTQVTNTAKGTQATTTSTTASMPRFATSAPKSGEGVTDGDDVESGPVRKRSSSVDLSDSVKIPPCMHITASICEDGLGLVSWWSNQEDDEEEEEGDEEEIGEGEEDHYEEGDEEVVGE
jgi:DNA-directed RNA polymerase III subunit RPC8